jgi:hypothetical protein
MANHLETHIMIRSPPPIFTFAGISLAEVATWSQEKKASRVYFDMEAIDRAINYQRLPRRFCADSWPTSSNLKCWHCDIVIGDIAPKFIPVDPSKGGSGLQCDAYGAFGSWACAIAYVDLYFSGSKRSDSRNLIATFAREIDGIDGVIHPAPPRTIMSAYCGETGITPEEYRARVH